MPIPNQDPIKDAEKAADTWTAACKPTAGADINKDTCAAARQTLQEALAKAKSAPYKAEDIQLLKSYLIEKNITPALSAKPTQEQIYNAVISVQTSLGLIGKNGDVKPGVAVGILGHLTIQALRQNVSSPSPSPQALIAFPPQRQADLVAIARARPLTLDGKPIQITLATIAHNREQALKAFQQSAGIEPATGQFDEATQKALALRTWLNKFDTKQAWIKFERYDAAAGAGKAGLLKVSLKNAQDFVALPKEVENALIRMIGVKAGETLEDAIQNLQQKHFGKKLEGMTVKTMNAIRVEAVRAKLTLITPLDRPLSPEILAKYSQKNLSTTTIPTPVIPPPTPPSLEDQAFSKENLTSLKEAVAKKGAEGLVIPQSDGARSLTLKYHADPSTQFKGDQIEVIYSDYSSFFYTFNWEKGTMQLVATKPDARESKITRHENEERTKYSNFGFGEAAKAWVRMNEKKE